MNRTDRLYAITEALRAAPAAGLTAAALAARFEVATRTVKRDVLALQEAGVPITGIGGPGGGYRLDAAATLPPITFTAGEALAVAVALATGDVAPFAADGRRALTKLVGAIPAPARDRAETLAGRVWVRDASAVVSVGGPARSSHGSDDDTDPDGGGARSGVDPHVVRVVEDAVRTGTVVLLDYVDGRGATTLRRPVEPGGLAHDGRRWHLLAWCRRRDAARWFRLDRILVAHATHEPVVARDVASAYGVPPPDAGPVTLG